MNTIEEIITSRGGIFIEELKIDGRKYIKFVCENAHEITKRSDSFKKTWCNQCQNNTIDDAHNLAKEKGFKFLSDEYINCKKLYLWECSEKHQWKAQYGNIKTGKGCPKCLMIPFSYFVNLIKEKKGTIITTEEEYENTYTKIRYKCKESHESEVLASSLRQYGITCLECNMSLCERTCRKIFEHLFQKSFPKSRHLKNPETNKGIELDGYNKELNIAFEYNGAQHYKQVKYWQTEEEFEYRQKVDKIKEELCKQEEINLIVIPYTVKYEDLYTFVVDKFPEYNFEKSLDYKLLKIDSYNEDRLEEIRKAIEKYQGTLLTDFYINNTTKMDFLCINGHEFQSTWGSIQQGFFCKKCTNNKISSKVLPKIQEFCEKYHFELLSEYTRAKDKLQWKCTDCNEILERSWDVLSRINKSHFLCKENTFG